MTQYIKKLPAVFQTVTERKFFDATFDQVFSKKDSDYLAGYLGRRIPGRYNPVNDFYLPEPSKNRTWWQLEATAFARESDSTKSNVFFYDDLLERIEYYGGNTLNQDRLFESEYYSFGPPIDYDMFINYQNYYWVEQGLSTIFISNINIGAYPTLDAYIEGEIIGKPAYTTQPTAVPPNLTFTTGLNVSFVGSTNYAEPRLVENFGGCIGIKLVEKFSDVTAGTVFELLPWDGEIELANGRLISNIFWDSTTWETQTQPSNGDYITIERGALDRNAWSRTNKWFHIDAINLTTQTTGAAFPTNATRALRPIIQFIADLTLFKSGTQFRSEIQYGFRDDALGNPLRLVDFQGDQLTTINSTFGIAMGDGDLVVFMNDDTPTVANFYPWDTANWDILPFTEWDAGDPTALNHYIFQANVQPDGSVNFAPYTSWATPVLEGDIIFITEDGPFDGAQRGSTWYYSLGVWQQVYNEKLLTNQPPLFQLYDHNGVELNDAITYPDSTFNGSEIFSYKINTEPGATVDPVLRFPIVYTSLGQASDIVFQNDLIVERYTYGAAKLDIDGYYYYKTTQEPILYNNWNLYQPCPCDDIVPPPPCNCLEVSKQRVIDKYVVGYGSEFQFRLSVTPYGYVFGAGAVQPLADIIVSVNNNEIKQYNPLTNPSGYLFIEINDKIYIDLNPYLTTLLTNTQPQPPVVEIQTYAIWVDKSSTTDYENGLLDPAATGYYEIPQQLEANPNQLEVGEISASNLTEHFSSIIANQIGFTGTSFGGDNNYRDSRKNRSVGKFILQNVAPLLKTMLVSSSNELDFILGERFSQDEYTKFKNKYLQTALQLINTGFNPVQYYNNTIVVSAWVEEILKTVNISKEFSNAFAYSYMIANGSPFANESAVVPIGGLITLTNYVDLSDPKNALYIYDTSGVEQLLVIGEDYEIVSTNLAIDIQFNTLNVSVGTPVFVALYKNPLPAYIPSTPTKIGAYPTYVPRIELDTTYITPTNVIIGHDGSKTIAYNDYRDNLLLELEIRIYNLLQYKFRHQYYVPLRVESVKAGYFRQTRYLRSEFLDITDSYLNKWSAKNRANYRANDWATASTQPGVVPDPYTGNIWKLYNYRDAVDSLAQPLDLPGNWKGIFQYYYDTYYPDTRPWEMLGFSEQPNWWQVEYGAPVLNGAGQEVWTSTATGNNVMWNDLEAGIIRQGPSAIYDPFTLVVQPQEMWVRPGLSAIIPVDAAGEIISVMTLFNVAYSGNPYAPFDTFEQDWVYGDGAPVEQAWMSTSAYAFMVQEFLYLMRPAPYGELMFDTVGTELSPGMITVPTSVEPVMSNFNWQYVQNDTFTNSDSFFAWMRPKNKDQVVHAESIDGVIQVRYGYQRWISDRILFLGTNVGDVFGQKIRTLDVNLANKLAGFTNKDTTNTYIESITPGSATTGLIIPTTNFEVFLHKSPPVETYSYSGVVIRALVDGTFAVYGYDLLNSEFLVLDRSNAKLIDVSIGGTPAPFQYFTAGATYSSGDIVRYNGVYYLSLVTQLVQKFETSGWQKLKGLPTVGGVSVTYRPVSLTTITKVPYGSILETAQDVFDLLIGWGAYLESRGWKFTEVSQETNQISDWLYSAKQFLFWLNSEWAPDASIQVSPAANKAILEVSRGYPEDVETISNGVYSILDKFGVAIAPTGTTTDREGQLISVEPANLASGGIYFLQVNATETEHVLIFDNTTNFNDIVYSPLLRARQQRLRFNGFRSNGWYGKMEAPGYLVIADQLVPNFDTIVEAMRYYYDPNVTIDNPSLEDLGRHLIGYESKSYLDNLQVSNDVQFLFYRGVIRQKGTNQAFEKLFRSTKVQSDEIIQVYEEWALKLSDFGNTVEQVSTEFKLRPEQNTGEVIVARLNFIPSEIGNVKQISILNAENRYVNVPSVFIAPPDADPLDPRLTEPLRQARAFIVLDSIGRISRVDITDGGYGYLVAPLIGIFSGAESNALDSLYSVWQGVIINDLSLDNVIDIDIDDTEKWTVRPNDPAFSLEFPVTDRIEYPLPTAGYVNFNDVDLSSFDVSQTAVRWGSTGFNPVENNTVWVAKTFTEDWNVYKLIDITGPSGFDVYANPAGELFLRTDPSYLITPQLTLGTHDTDFGNMIVLQVIEAQADATVSSGAITEIIITKAGANYVAAPTATITTNLGVFLTTTTVVAGEVTSVDIPVIVGVVTSATIVIDPPLSVSEDNNFTVGFTFNQDETSNEPTHNYYNLITLDANPITVEDIPGYANFTKLMLFKTMRFQTVAEALIPTYAVLGNKVWVDNIDLTIPQWAVYTKIVPTLTYPNGLEPFRQQEKLINSSLFENASVFGIRTAIELVQLPVYDPFKNILPGPAKQNITYTSMQDPARYNITSNPRLLNENITFGKRQVGQLWWDLSFTRYVYYEQPIALDGSETENDNLVYRRDRWGQIFPGSTVGIFEWVESPVPPAEYTGSGTPRDTTSYVQLVTSNRFTDATEVNFYFWVLNTTDRPNIENRTMAAINVSRLLQSPRSQGFAFFAPIQQTSTNNSYMFYNVQEILAYQGNNVQIQYRLSERDDQEHAQWKFFREGDTGSIVTDQFWNKMVDSLCGYTKVLPLSNEYSNEIVLYNNIPWDIYGWDTLVWDAAAYGVILPVPDPSLSEGEKYGIEYRPRQSMFVRLQAARKVFVQSANSLLQHIAIRDDNPAWNLNVATDVYWDYTNWYAVGFEDAIPSVVFQTLLQANTALTAGQLVVGDIVQVTNGTIDGRFVLYNVVQLNPNVPTLSLNEVGIEKSAIKLLDTVYTTVNVYGLSVELRELLNAFRTEVMVDEFLVDQNEVYFSMMNYVLSEQKNPDWVFKTSYIYIKENNQPLTQKLLYTPNQIDDVIDFINDVKPYHTKIRDYTTVYVTTDIAPGTASDSYKTNITLAFGPDNMDYGDPGHWDALCNDDTMPNPWDNYAWDVCPPQTYILDAQTFVDNIEQFVSREDVYTVPLTFFDISKIGYSQLFPYTFNFNSINLNNPQSAPQDIVGVQIGTDILIYGQDYYAEYNVSDQTYTIYFYNNPGNSPVPVALVWYDGGGMQHFRYNTVRNEIAYGFANDGLVVNVDTKKPVSNAGGIIGPFEGNWDAAPWEVDGLLGPDILWDPSILPFNNILSITHVGNVATLTSIMPHGIPLTPAYWTIVLGVLPAEYNGTFPITVTGPNTFTYIMSSAPNSNATIVGTYYLLADETISSRENTNTNDGANFYRNADAYAGTLFSTLLAPTDVTYNVQTITVTAASDIFPDPVMTIPGVIWIRGERIEYLMKTLVGPNKWDLSLVRRGTMGTAATEHAATSYVFVEAGNVMPINSNVEVWNSAVVPAAPNLSSLIAPGEYTSILYTPIGGLWYAPTPQATFLILSPGRSIP